MPRKKHQHSPGRRLALRGLGAAGIGGIFLPGKVLAAAERLPVGKGIIYGKMPKKFRWKPGTFFLHNWPNPRLFRRDLNSAKKETAVKALETLYPDVENMQET